MVDFTHLHVHSEYSLLDGLSKIEKLLRKALELGMDSLALTDHGSMYGAIKFFLTAQDYGIKPIIGVEAYVAARSRFDKQANIDSDRHHLILLAKNEEGYKNLMKLVTHANLEGFYYKPRIDMDLLKEHHEGLIASTACLEGEIPSLILKGQEEKAEEKAKEFLAIFEKDFYFEIQYHPKIAEQEKANKGLIKLSRKLGIPLLATNDVHYVNADDAEAQDALLAVQTQKLIADKDRLTMIDSPDFYLRSSEEMSEYFADYPEAIENTRKIASQCNLEIPIGKWILPRYEIPEGETAESYLKKLSHERLADRFPNTAPEIMKRLDYELDVICKKGFATYFLIVQDFINWAKKQKIRVGPGRGSAPGSLVSYVLRITSIDPIYHNLPFERFLNPERPSPPDIDMDFADDRRDEVIEYITQKYGSSRVAQIITFGTIEARGAIRDIGRILGMPYSEPDKIAKLIPIGASLAGALKSVPELNDLYRQARYRKLLDLAQKVEGVARHASTHAAGLVIADKELTEYTPLQLETKSNRVMTQYDMYSLDLNVSEKAVGLLKIDLLGLRNLTILEKALSYIKLNEGKDIDLSEISIEDKATIAMIASGETTGIFQLESEGMRRVIRKLKPTRFSDIAAMVALYRPGPMQFIDEFIAGKRNPRKVSYPHPDLKLILAETYGIAVYQEQCLQIANVMAGYTLGEADILRRAIGKKKKEMMAKEKVKFIKKAQKLGYGREIAEKVYGLIERFAGYGFNKAHTVSYAMIAYQTAYLKTHFPVEFMAALLTAEAVGASGPTKDEKISLGVTECRRMKILVLPPSINQSKASFTIEQHPGSFEDRAIRFGFSAVKNVGDVAINAIIEAREIGGEFKSLADFCKRVDVQKANKKVLESLIKVGAMDIFGKRAAMLSALDKIREQGLAAQKQKINGQSSLFDNESLDDPPTSGSLPDMAEFERSELLFLERSLLGIYLTDNPLQPVMAKIEKYITHKLVQIDKDEHQGKKVRVGGMVSDMRIVITRNSNQEMAFVSLEDDTGSLELVVFPKIYSQTKSLWVKDRVVLIEGKVEFRDDKLSILIDKAFPPEEIKEDQGKSSSFSQGIEIRIPSNTSARRLVDLNKLLKENQGNHQAVLIFVDSFGREKRMALPFNISYTQKLSDTIKEIIG